GDHRDVTAEVATGRAGPARAPGRLACGRVDALADRLDQPQREPTVGPSQQRADRVTDLVLGGRGAARGRLALAELVAELAHRLPQTRIRDITFGSTARSGRGPTRGLRRGRRPGNAARAPGSAATGRRRPAKAACAGRSGTAAAAWRRARRGG